MANCFKCGSAQATIHVTQSLAEDEKTFSYCEDCFDQSEFKAKVENHGVPPIIESSLFLNIRHFQQAFKERTEICERSGYRFPPETYDFIQECLPSISSEALNPAERSQVMARALTQAARDNAKRKWGRSAKVELERRGIVNALDIGDIVFLMIEMGILGKRPELKREDFHDLQIMED